MSSVRPLSLAARDAIENLPMDFTSALSTIQHQQVLEAFSQLDFLSQGSQHPKLFQFRCLVSLLSARHVVLRAATGSGKTLAMILPLLLSPDKTAITVTPLKLLQRDHVQEFEQYGIPSIAINHDTPSDKNLWNELFVTSYSLAHQHPTHSKTAQRALLRKKPSFQDIQPDFSSPTFEALRNRIIGGTQTTHDEVAADLIAAWQQDLALRAVAWTRQMDEDVRLTAEATRAELELRDQERLQLEHEAKVELREAEKKKPKINDFVAGVAVGDTLTPYPSQYTIHKLKAFEYVELWYFSPDGCKATADEAKTNADNTFGFTKVEDFIAL
ncbi:hypothetical protein EV702DRAFT_1238597 [Suillus placidus]|uniref:Helicase ATP-binding domain-containing protein n=1 Tax=Suillus placidus TaxID=48579 RepID=A0A9P7A4Z7_9AGAM|nr:hypothetical protein EV702DRAFT_1238597 [Suillus placidus]